jgi:hypothetical protein
VLAFTAGGRFRGFIRFFFLNQGMAAAVAKIAARGICFAAAGAGYFKLTAAFVAKTGIDGIIGLALGALHFLLPFEEKIYYFVIHE